MPPPAYPPGRNQLVGLLALQSVVCIRPARSSGSSRPQAFPFPVSAAVLLRVPSPARCQAGSSSRELSLPFRVLPLRARPATIVGEAPSLGFRPSSRRQPAASVARDSHSRTRPSSAFRTPSTVCSATGLAGLFHPAATSRVRSSGVFPPVKPYRLIDGPYPRDVVAGPLPDGCPPSSTNLRPAFRACSPPGSVAAPTGVSRRHRPIPS